jgi:acetyltransferase-like isoleucine patch superfamily enzyme
MAGPLSNLNGKLGLDEILFEFMSLVESIRYGQYRQLWNTYYREKIKETAEEVGSDLYVGGESNVNSKTVLGDNVNLIGIKIKGEGRVTIGDNFHAGSGSVIITTNHNYDHGDAIPYDDTYIREAVQIGDNVWLGTDVTVLPGVSIGEGAVIQTGSVVTEDIPKGAIAGGHPAKVFDHRDMSHYETLKAQGKFN